MPNRRQGGGQRPYISRVEHAFGKRIDFCSVLTNLPRSAEGARPGFPRIRGFRCAKAQQAELSNTLHGTIGTDGSRPPIISCHAGVEFGRRGVRSIGEWDWSAADENKKRYRRKCSKSGGRYSQERPGGEPGIPSHSGAGLLQ